MSKASRARVREAWFHPGGRHVILRVTAEQTRYPVFARPSGSWLRDLGGPPLGFSESGELVVVQIEGGLRVVHLADAEVLLQLEVDEEAQEVVVETGTRHLIVLTRSSALTYSLDGSFVSRSEGGRPYRFAGSLPALSRDGRFRVEVRARKPVLVGEGRSVELVLGEGAASATQSDATFDPVLTAAWGLGGGLGVAPRRPEPERTWLRGGELLRIRRRLSPLRALVRRARNSREPGPHLVCLDEALSGLSHLVRRDDVSIHLRFVGWPRSHRSPLERGLLVALPRDTDDGVLERLRVDGVAPREAQRPDRAFEDPSSTSGFVEAGLLLTLLEGLASQGPGPLGHRIVVASPEAGLADAPVASRAARKLRLRGDLHTGALAAPKLPPVGRAVEFRPWLERATEGDVVLRFVVLHAERNPRYEAHRLRFPKGSLSGARLEKKTIAAQRPSAAR